MLSAFVFLQRTHWMLLIINETITRASALSLSFYTGLIISNSGNNVVATSVFDFLPAPVILFLIVAILGVLGSIILTNLVKANIDGHGCVKKKRPDGLLDVDFFRQYICDSPIEDKRRLRGKLYFASFANICILLLASSLALGICFSKTINPVPTITPVPTPVPTPQVNSNAPVNINSNPPTSKNRSHRNGTSQNKKYSSNSLTNQNTQENSNYSSFDKTNR